jgi:hypothetical protein
MDAFVPDLVRDNERSLRVVSDIFGEYRTALIVEDGASALKRRIARRKPRQTKLEMLDGGLDEFHGLLGRPIPRQLTVEVFRSLPDGFERIHSLVPKRQQLALLIFA